MLKKSLVAASFLLVTSSSFAQNEYFVGLGIGSASWTPETKTTNSVGTVMQTTSESDSAGVFSILGGTIINDTHKLGIGYSFYNTDGSNDMSSIELGYAYYLHNALKITNKKWKPFVSVGYTINKYTEDLDSPFNTSEAKLTTKAVMLGFGTDYVIDQSQFLSVGYDFSVSTSGDESVEYTTGGNTYDVELETDKISRFLFSYNYKF